MSEIKQAYAMLNGVKIPATYNEETKLWTVETNAPSASSWNETDHVYLMSLHAEDMAGNSSSLDSTDSTYGSQLKFRVLEKTKPTATIISPTEGAVLGEADQSITMEIQDAGGSGLNMSSIVFKLNGSKVTSGLNWTKSGDKYTCTYEAVGLSDGSNKVELQVSDNDGNVSSNAVINFVISTAAPTLSLDTPVDNLLTNSNKVTVSGTARPGSSAVTLAEVTINGRAVTVDSNGHFSSDESLVEGTNAISTTAKDSIGKTTTIVRTVVLDTKAPVISDVVAEATTVDANGRIRITFKVVDR